MTKQEVAKTLSVLASPYTLEIMARITTSNMGRKYPSSNWHNGCQYCTNCLPYATLPVYQFCVFTVHKSGTQECVQVNLNTIVHYKAHKAENGPWLDVQSVVTPTPPLVSPPSHKAQKMTVSPENDGFTR